MDDAKSLIPPQLELMLLRAQVEKAKKRRRRSKMPLKSPTIAAIRRAILFLTLPSQKTSYSLSNFHIGDCKHEG